MNRRTALTAAAGAGVLSLGLLAGGAIAADRQAPAAATVDGCTGDCETQAASPAGYGGGQGAGGAGQGSGHGGQDASDADHDAVDRGPDAATADHTTYPSGEITAAQAADLIFMVQEEKLAHDLYVAFYEEYEVRTFDRIAQSEDRHMDAVRTLLTTYGLDDPTVGLDEGEFVDQELAEMYDALLAQGMVSLDEAMAVGQAVEIDDIAELDEAMAGVTAADVEHVYSQLRAGSEKHLSAYGG